MRKTMRETNKQSDKMEQRAFTFEVRANHDEKHGDYIEGRPIVYGKETDIGGMFREEICAGALDEADLTDVRFLVNHDTCKIPLARSRNNNENSTMRLKVDREGLWIRASLDTENNAEARALYSAVQRGDITGMSFLFAIAEERWEDMEEDYPKRFVEKISTVVEVSAVTFPAYQDTDISARNKETLESARKALESARSTLESVKGEVEGLESQDARAELEMWKYKIRILGGLT